MDSMMNKSASLTSEQKRVLQEKGTEPPHQGHYNVHDVAGTYLCRQCGLALFRSTDKFLSSCGWPSFDDEIAGVIERVSDTDGIRTEITCQRCKGHLGHVFTGEHLSKNNLRHCVNSVSVDFTVNQDVLDTEEAIFAGGCFWGVEALLKKEAGVMITEVGYTGGDKELPTYNEVCAGTTGHYEAIRVVFDVKKTTYETICKAFLESHDITQGEGGTSLPKKQYQSALFFYNKIQCDIANNLLSLLKAKGFVVRTVCLPVTIFWKAEHFHQDYYAHQGQEGQCHLRETRF